MAARVVITSSNHALFLLGIVTCDKPQTLRLIQLRKFKDVSEYVFSPKWDFMILQLWK